MVAASSNRCICVFVDENTHIRTITDLDEDFVKIYLETGLEFFKYMLLEKVDSRNDRNQEIRTWDESYPIISSPEWMEYPELGYID